MGRDPESLLSELERYLAQGDVAEIPNVRLKLWLLRDQIDDADTQARADRSIRRLEVLEHRMSCEPVDATRRAECADAFRETVEIGRAAVSKPAARTSRNANEGLYARCAGVERGYPGTGFRLTGINLEIHRGEITVVVGSNASGKSTLLKVLAGELRVDRGQITFPGVATSRPGRVPRGRIGFVRQEPEAWPGKFREHLELRVGHFGHHGLAGRLLVNDAMSLFRLNDVSNCSWPQLTGGMRVRCALAAAIAPQPEMVVLDEPLSSLDHVTRRDFLNELYVLANSPRRRIAIVLSTHHVAEVEPMADRLIVLDNGTVVFAGSSEDVVRQHEDTVIELDLDGAFDAFRQALEQDLGQSARGLRVDARKDLRRVQITLPSSVSRVDVLRVMAKHGFHPRGFRDLSRSVLKLS